MKLRWPYDSLASKGKVMDGGPYRILTTMEFLPFLPLGAMHSAGSHMHRLCKSYGGVISVTALLFVEIFHIKFPAATEEDVWRVQWHFT